MILFAQSEARSVCQAGGRARAEGTLKWVHKLFMKLDVFSVFR